MRAYDVIMKKRDGEALSKEEIEFLIEGYVAGEIPDYQMSAFLMAVYFNGMSHEETLEMTLAVAKSGDMVDLSPIKGIKVDKHSTGGVGDKTTLIVAPIVAACGIKVAKMSGRGLGHTGGTIDKLEAIPGYNTELDRQQFFDAVNETGLAVIGQSGNITPADKKMYALRDVTATVDSIPLIAVSIMGKKLAAGSDCILLDVKTGSGAFMKSVDDSITLAGEMVSIGCGAGKNTMALITDMDRPLGNNIGNALEVIEAVNTLNGKGPDDLTNVCIELAANMLSVAGLNDGNVDENRTLAKSKIDDGTALDKLLQMVDAQGGDSSYIKDVSKFEKTKYKKEIISEEGGYIYHMDTEGIGIASSLLGAGRITKDDDIDYAAGIILHKKTGDALKTGDVIATLYSNNENLFKDASNRFNEAIVIKSEAPSDEPLVYARVTKDAVERY